MPNPELKLTLPAWSEPYQHRIGQSFTSRESRMALAIELAQQNIDHGSGGPFGAAVFDHEGRLIAIGMNLVTSAHCSVLHAEIVALMLAEQSLDRYDLSNGGTESFELVTSTEPCTMCLGAVIWSGVNTLTCGAHDEDARAIGFDEGPKPENWFAELERRGITVIRSLLRAHAAAVLQHYGNSALQIYNPGRQASRNIN